MATWHYGIEGVGTWSGGTEATAFNPRAVNAIENAGFEVKMVDNSDNPKYEIRYSDEVKPALAFSKKYSDNYNPQKNFIAVMTCSDADKNCPVVSGAEYRVSLTYEDPKEYDGTEMETDIYNERCMQIATEIFYAFGNAKNILNN